MTSDQLDAWIDAASDPAVILLTEADWRITMLDPAAQPHISFAPGDLHYVYRGLPVLIALEGGSRIIGRVEAVRDRWVSLAGDAQAEITARARIDDAAARRSDPHMWMALDFIVFAWRWHWRGVRNMRRVDAMRRARPVAANDRWPTLEA